MVFVRYDVVSLCAYVCAVKCCVCVCVCRYVCVSKGMLCQGRLQLDPIGMSEWVNKYS